MSDYNFLMESRLSPEQFAVISLFSRLAAEQGLNLYLVGGAVRDLTYGQQVVRDLDFIVEGSPMKMLRNIPSADSAKPARGGQAPGGESALAIEYQSYDAHFSSAEMVFNNGVRAELAMSREEYYARPGQRPEVRPAMVFEDLKRRDFAINAMAVSLHPNSRGLLLDPTNGAGDLERHEIRALSSRTFLDDPSRLYRLLRLGMRFDFKPDERTQRWFDAAVEDGAWQRLEADQQARELAAILREDQPGRLLKLLADRKFLGGLDTKLGSVRLSYDRFARVRSVLQTVPSADPFLLNFHCLVEKLGGDQKARLAKRLLEDNKAIKLALGIEAEAKKLERVLGSAKASLPSQVYSLLSPQPQPLLLFLLANTKHAKVQNRIKSFLFKFPEIRSRLPRAELQSLGVIAGPEFDQILARIFALQLDGKIKTHQQLMKNLRELAGIKEPPPAPPPVVHPPRKGKEAAPAPAPQTPRKGRQAVAPPPLPPPKKGKKVEAALESPAKKAAKGGAAKTHVKPAAARKAAKPAPKHKTAAAKPGKKRKKR